MRRLVTCLLLLCLAPAGALPARLSGDTEYPAGQDAQPEPGQLYQQQVKDQEQLLKDGERLLYDQEQQLEDQQKELSWRQQLTEQQQKDRQQLLRDQVQLERDQQRNQDDQLQQLRQREQERQLLRSQTQRSSEGTSESYDTPAGQSDGPPDVSGGEAAEPEPSPAAAAFASITRDDPELTVPAGQPSSSDSDPVLPAIDSLLIYGDAAEQATDVVVHETDDIRAGSASIRKIVIANAVSEKAPGDQKANTNVPQATEDAPSQDEAVRNTDSMPAIEDMDKSAQAETPASDSRDAENAASPDERVGSEQLDSINGEQEFNGAARPSVVAPMQSPNMMSSEVKKSAKEEPAKSGDSSGYGIEETDTEMEMQKSAGVATQAVAACDADYSCLRAEDCGGTMSSSDKVCLAAEGVSGVCCRSSDQTSSSEDEQTGPEPSPEPVPVEPAPTTSEPSTTTPEPAPTTSEPSPTSPEPAPTSPEPSPTIPEPARTTSKPSPTSPEPTPTTTEPSPTSPEPVVATSKSPPTATEPATTTTSKPSPATTEASATTTEPAPSTPEPAPTTSEPTPTTLNLTLPIPISPTPQCPGEQVCVRRWSCGASDRGDKRTSSSSTGTDSGVQSCYLESGEPGVCCAPADEGTEILCNFSEECVGSDTCGTDGFILTNPEEVEVRSAAQKDRLGPFGTFCRLPSGSRGRCCRRPDPEWPAGTPVPRCGHSHHIPLPGDDRMHAREALFGEIPWQATIFEKGTNNFICGGTIVSARNILTSEHCLQKYHNTDIFVRVGDYIIYQDSEPLPYQDLDIYSIRSHPETGALFNDIVVMKLVREIQFGPHVQPICLPELDQQFVGSRCIISGWGKPAFVGNYSERMERLEVAVVDRDVCVQNLQDTHLGHFFELDDSMLCAGGEKGVDACRADAGGPLACRSADGSYVLAGVTAWSVGCSLPSVPSVFTSVSSTLSFTSHYITGGEYHPFYRSNGGVTRY